MSNPGRGGRGKKADYLTTHYRIPVNIKPTVQRLATAYKIMFGSVGELATHNLLIKSVDDVISQSTGLDNKSPSEIEILQQRISQLETENSRLKQSERDALNQLCECHSEAFKAADILNAVFKVKRYTKQMLEDAIKEAVVLIDDV